MAEAHTAWRAGTCLEHFAGALAVAGRDDRGVDVKEAVALEEGVGGVGELVADAGDGADRVGAWPQVRLLAQELHAVLLLRHRVRRAVTRPKVQDLGRLDLHFLLHPCSRAPRISQRHSTIPRRRQERSPARLSEVQLGR